MSGVPLHPMLDVRLFHNMRFSAASAAVTVSFFTLFGFIFLMTQYFQFVRNYGPLSAGVHLLPVALAVGVGSVAGTQLAVRAGTKLIVTTGLIAMAAFYGWVASDRQRDRSATASSRPRWCSTGLGMGLTSAPATESIMGAISRAQGRRRFGGQRLHEADRRHARRRRHRQCFRICLRIPAHRIYPGERARAGRGDRTSVRRCGLRGRRQDRGPRPPGPGTGTAARLHASRLPARPHRRLLHHAAPSPP